MLLFAMDLVIAQSRPKGRASKGRARVRVTSKSGWTSVAGCGADSNGQRVTALDASSSAYPILDAAIAGNAKCSSYERIAVYSCIPEPPPIDGLWKKIGFYVGGLNTAVGTFASGVYTVGASFAIGQMFEAISAFSPSPDLAALDKEFEALVNDQLDNLNGCIKESQARTLAISELHDWEEEMGNIQTFGDFRHFSLTKEAAEISNKFRNFFAGVKFRSDSSFVRQIEALPILTGIMPMYMTVAGDHLAILYGLCKEKKNDLACSEFVKFQKTETNHTDTALEWLYNVKSRMLAQYESWIPEECDEWTNQKYDQVTVDIGGPGDWGSNDIHYTSHRECGPFTADIINVCERWQFTEYRSGELVNVDRYKSDLCWNETNTITFGEARVPTDDVDGLQQRPRNTLQFGTLSLNRITYTKGPADVGLSVVKQRVVDAIYRYKTDIKSWSNDFDNKFILPLMKFREDINSTVIEQHGNEWQQICYPQDECADLYMNKSDNGNYECVKMPGKCVQQRHAPWQKTCGGTASYNAPCVFPFTYKGTEYNKCITHDHKDGRPWCSTTANYTKDGQWGNCDCKPWELSTCDGTGQNAPCVFPFKYKNKTYYDCTTEDHPKPWCSTTADFDTDKRWGNCACQPWELRTCDGTGRTKPCVFPFKYKNKKYYDCTTDDHKDGKLWCSTTWDYDTDKKWGHCNCADEAASAMSNPFERIGDDFIGDGSDEMPVYGPSGGEYSPYLFYFVAFVPCLLCVFVNVFCAYKQCAKKEDSYDEVRFVEEEEEDEDEKLMDQDNKI